MRARYSAFAAGDGEFLWRTWHPRTRPTTVQLDTGTGWTSLEVVYVAAGEPGDERGEVEFRAHYRDAAGAGVLHERSTFLLRARRWFYLDGDIHR